MKRKSDLMAADSQEFQPTQECLFIAWNDFVAEDYYADHPIVVLIHKFLRYFDCHYQNCCEYLLDEDLEAVLNQNVMIDFKDLNIDIPLEKFKNDPTQVFNAMNIAATQMASKYRNELGLSIPGVTYNPIMVRIANNPNLVSLKDIKANLVGKWIAVSGTIVKVGQVRPLIVKMAFLCTKCNKTIQLSTVDGRYCVPDKCIDGCKSKSFIPDISSKTITIDWQRVRLQEKLTDDQVDSGRVPRTIDIELEHELVETVVPGDVCIVSGIVKLLNSDQIKGKSNQTYQLYINANFIGKAGSENDNSLELGTKDSLVFSDRDLFAIREIHNESNLFHLLVHSVCPGIFGHEMIKAGLLLTLFGGRRREESMMRSNSHMLIVGDPGLGKSQLLMSTVKLAPRGVYVSGNSCTNSGLTVTVSKDAQTGDSALEAGALVLADQGVCCIDEFDKMNDHQSLLEAMEQQSISVAKASIVCTLPARCSIIAAANPVGGHYDKIKTISENLKMNGALLSRFDLVFILLDKPNVNMDKFLSHHIMNIHSGNQQLPIQAHRTLDPDEYPNQQQSLAQALAQPPESEIIPPQLLRKYIAYARMYTRPKLSEEAKNVLLRFYLVLRSKYRSHDATPITTRQLESMIRLAEARARCELRDNVTEDDAVDVIEIMKFSLWDSYENEKGAIDFTRSQHGSGTSKGSESKRLISELFKMVKQSGNSRFTRDTIEIACNHLKLSKRVDELIEALNHQGYLIKKGNATYDFLE